MRRSLLLIALAAVSLFSGVPRAGAADLGGSPMQIFADAPIVPHSWSGLYLGAHGGVGIADGIVGAGPVSIDGFAAHGAKGGVDGMALFQLPRSNLVLGSRASYTWDDENFTVSVAGHGDVLRASLDHEWSVDGMVGIAMGNALPYGFLGYGEAATSASAGGTALHTPTLTGWHGGGGMAFRVPNIPNLSVAVDYTYTPYREVSLCAACGAGGPTLRVDDNAVMLRANWQLVPFSGGGAEARPMK